MFEELEALAKAIVSGKPPVNQVKYVVTEEVQLPEELSVFSLDKPNERFNFVGVDAASITLYTPYGEVAITSGAIGTLNRTSYYPSKLRPTKERGPPYVGALESGGLDWVTDKYILLGTPYKLDPFLPEGAISHDIRIGLESYLISRAKKLFKNALLLIDGPATYPFSPVTEGSKWSVELGLLNKLRVKALMEAFAEGLTPICVVKRVWGSAYIPEAVAEGNKDVSVVMNYVSKHFPLTKPLIIGPWENRGRVGVPDRIMAYLAIPINPYLHTVSVLRIEVLRDIAESINTKLIELAKALSWEIMEYGTYVPPAIQVADKLSKALVRRHASLIETVFKRTGVLILYSGEGIE